MTRERRWEKEVLANHLEGAEYVAKALAGLALGTEVERLEVAMELLALGYRQGYRSETAS